MARKSSGSKKSRKSPTRKASRPLSSKVKSRRSPKRLGHLTTSQESQRIRSFEAANLYRQGKAKTASAAARMARTNLKAMWRWIPRAIKKDPRTGRLRIKASDRYSQKVEVLTDAGALVVTARGSRQRQLAGQHRATYMDVARKKKPPSALQQFRGKKVGSHELLSDYARLVTLAKAGVLGQLDTLYVGAGGGR
jgi:hypothetical protein